jgi:signal transduction histidine kinase
MDAIDLRTGSAKHFVSSNEDLFQILKIVVDRKKNIWVSTSNGLMLFSGNKLIPKNISLRSVYDFKEWDDTNLILATRVNGIYLFDRITGNTSLFISADDLNEEASCMLIEEDHLWVGCKDGLKLYNREGKLTKHFKASNDEPRSLHSSFIKCLYRDSRENLWIGTWGGGLSLLIPEDSSFTTYTAHDGLPNNVIYGILEDRSGNLWLSTNVGLSVFNLKDRVSRNFNFFDGLQSNEFNTGAYFESTGGKMYFGGVNGLNFFYPEEILVHHPVPSILKTSVAINNKALTFQDSDSLKNVMMINNLTLGWKENDIGVKFTAIDFKNAQQQIFQYSIEDKTWYDIGDRRSLELLDLPSGFHEIKARIRKPGTGWSQDVVLLAIDIVPPVWQRAWFRMMSVLAFLVVIFAFYRYKVKRLKQLNATLNRLVSKRTMEIQAMNEEILSQNDQLQDMVKELEAFSYSISHDLRAPLRSLIGYSKMLEEDFNEKLDEEGRRMLNVIQHNAARMNNMIDDLLKFSKLGKTELQKFKIDSEKLLKNILAEINISTQHNAEIKLNPVPPIFADSELISQVWINLISNAIKYSAKKETPVVEIGSYSDGDEVVFYIKDNGAGFDMKYVDKLFGVFQRLHKMDEFEGTGVGLALVHRIVAKHGGRVWAEGEVNQGATFYFSLLR